MYFPQKKSKFVHRQKDKTRAKRDKSTGKLKLTDLEIEQYACQEKIELYRQFYGNMPELYRDDGSF